MWGGWLGRRAVSSSAATAGLAPEKFARPPSPTQPHNMLASRLENGEEDEEESVRMVRPATAEPAEVDEDFEREFQQLILDHQGRPAQGAGARASEPAAAAAAAADQGAARAAGPAAAPAVAFKVMMKRGGREDRSRELHIPLSAGMAAHLRQKEEAEAAEKAELKRLVLQANARDIQVGGWVAAGVEGWRVGAQWDEGRR